MANKKDVRLVLLEIKTDFKLGKDVYNQHGKFYYRTLPQILQALKPYENKHKVLFELDSELVELSGRVFSKGIAEVVDIETGISLVSHSFSEIPAIAPRGMQHSQSSGSSETYALKRALGNLLGIDDSTDADMEITDTEVVTNEGRVIVPPTETKAPSGSQEVRDIMSLRGEMVKTLTPDLTSEKLDGWYKELNEMGGDDKTLIIINAKANQAGFRLNEETKKYEKVGI